MNDWERSICARVKTVRESINWSQAAFAEQLGITMDQLASIEYGRTPLRFDIAWRLRQAFGISLLWLEGDDSVFPDSFTHDDLPIPTATGMPARALLSEVAEKFRSPGSPDLEAIDPESEDSSAEVTENDHRWFCEFYLKMQVEDWIARLPDGYTAAFRDEIARVAESIINSQPKDSNDVIERRSEQLRWNRIKIDNARRILVALGLTKKVLHHDTELS